MRTILEMVHHTRNDTVAAPAAFMRQGLVQAIHHARYRKGFGKRLIEQPLMKNVLADLAIEAEAATVLSLRIARGFDEAPHDDEARAFTRIATAVAKYWLNKRAPGHVVEALECLGGVGYVEESGMPRLYREAPLNGIWKARATSSASTCCAPWGGSRERWSCSSPRCVRRAAAIAVSTDRLTDSNASYGTRPIWR